VTSLNPPAVEVVNSDAPTPLVFMGDHGGNRVPAAMTNEVGPLGLPAVHLTQHIGWDIGAASVARGLAQRLSATAVLAVYTRLLIDPNRALGDPDSIPATSDGIPIPANAGLSAADVQARADQFFWPYHMAVDRQLARHQYAGRVPLLIAIHSFTPALMSTGQPRPWHVGVMASRDLRLADRLLAALKAKGGLVVGYNEPYSGITHGYCLKMHGLAQGLPHAQIEVRQDLIEDASGQEKWADLLADILRPIVADEALRAIQHF
jgi:predicted N-formylglutamate amidohydrolase